MSEENTQTDPQVMEPATGENTPAEFSVGELPAIDPVEPSNEPTPAEEESYSLTLDEAHHVDADIATYMTEQAKELGLPAQGVSQFVNSVLANAAESEKKAQVAQVDALRKEWGAEFDKRAKATMDFTNSIGKAIGLNEQDAAFLSTPSGYRLMYKLSKMFTEQKAVTGAGTSESAMSKEQRRAMAEDMRTNPSNPYYKCFTDVSLRRSERVPGWKRFNELVGREVYPEA